MNNNLTKENHFDQIVEYYDNYAYLHQSVGQELVQRLDLLSLEVNDLLELGVGTGQLLPALLKTFPKINLHMLDISEKMLQKALKKLSWKQKLFGKNYQHHCAAERLSLDKESIDLVLSNLLLPYVEDIQPVFEQVQSVLRADGVFCFSSFGPDTLKEFQQVLQVVQPNISNLHIGQLVDMHIIGDQLIQAGFREPVMDVELKTLAFSSFENLWQELFYSGIISGSIEQAVKDEFEKMYAQYCQPDGLWPVTFEVVYGQAWATSNQVLQDNKLRQQNGTFSFPLDQLKRR